MSTLVSLTYLVSSVMFIIGIKLMTRIPTAKRGNQISAVGMMLAVLVTIAQMHYGDAAASIAPGSIGWTYVIIGLLVGTLIGVWISRTVKMTAMPELVALFNGLGGAASALVVVAYFFVTDSAALDWLSLSAALAGLVIGVLTFTGSMVAYGKLNGSIPGQPITFRGQHAANLIVAIGTLIMVFYFALYPEVAQTLGVLMIIIGLTALLGVLLVIPIGGADMPVVISLLNAYSGIAAAATGFVFQNTLLITSGALVGASGIILSQIMCRAMNRSLMNVLFGGFGHVQNQPAEHSEYESITEISSAEAALMFDAAESVIIVPGYGMAVSQAQYAVEELTQLLIQRGTTVVFAIHPVAGRMPGHMNVLLAEASIPYDILKDIDQVNNSFKQASVVYVIGANDVVNPAAANDPGSPIYGMPILKCHEAQSVIVVKRSLSPGFAGIKNDLFERDNAVMLFDDAKKATEDIVSELKGL